MVRSDPGRGGGTARHLPDLAPGASESAHLHRIERCGCGDQLPLPVPDHEPPIEPDVELDLLPGATAPVGPRWQHGAIARHGALIGAVTSKGGVNEECFVRVPVDGSEPTVVRMKPRPGREFVRQGIMGLAASGESLITPAWDGKKSQHQFQGGDSRLYRLGKPGEVLAGRRLADAQLVRSGRDRTGGDVRPQDRELPAVGAGGETLTRPGQGPHGDTRGALPPCPRGGRPCRCT